MDAKSLFAIFYALAGLLVLAVPSLGATASWRDGFEGDRQVYMEACAVCHGADGRGAARHLVGFEVPLPDFTDCNFATREPYQDWIAVAHEGGPARGFSPVMPAFGGALTEAEIERALSHVRTFCPSDQWPRGELNLPKPLVTMKAFPEDEAVLVTTVATEGAGSVVNELVYERRFGARNQFEIALPFGWKERAADGGDEWRAGLGDLVFGLKRTMFHSLQRGAIISISGELIVPSGDEQNSFSADTVIFEPSLAYGQILPARFFLNSQGGLGFPVNGDKANEEAFVRLAIGRSFIQGHFGRLWSPMVEILAARELASGAQTQWDALPEMQITLSSRQHIRLNAGVRVPLNDANTRDTEFIVYALWDWFDGALTEGW